MLMLYNSRYINVNPIIDIIINVLLMQCKYVFNLYHLSHGINLHYNSIFANAMLMLYNFVDLQMQC